jgi:hypothetical protein
MWAAGVMTERVLVSVPINCAAVLGAGVEAGVEAVPAGGLDVERAEVL